MLAHLLSVAALWDREGRQPGASEGRRQGDRAEGGRQSRRQGGREVDGKRK